MAVEPPVTNATPLIVLARVDRLDLLQLKSDRVIVPRVVAEESRRRGPDDPAVRAITRLDWLEVMDTGLVAAEVVACRIDPGEGGVLTWALAHPGVTAILDDLAGRRCAASLGIPVAGTLGLVIAAKELGIIAAARPVVEAVRRVGLYLSDQIVERALARVGE